MPDGDGQAGGGLDRLLEHLDSYFLVAELVAGWRAGLLAALLQGPGTGRCSRPRPGSGTPSTRNGSASTWPCCWR